MRISDWSSDVCPSDLLCGRVLRITRPSRSWKSITWLLSTRDSRILARLTQFWGSPTGVASTTRELAWPAPGPADSSAADVQAASATASATTTAAGFMTSLRLFCGYTPLFYGGTNATQLQLIPNKSQAIGKAQ